MSCTIHIDDLASVTLLFDGAYGALGPLLGVYGTPPEGGKLWYARNGEFAYCYSDAEAEAAIKVAAVRPSPRPSPSNHVPGGQGTLL